MDHIETAILNCYGIREAEQNMVFAARLTQHGHTIQNMADLMDLYRQSYSQKTVENIAGLPHPTVQKFMVITVAVVGASRRFLAQITRHQNEVKYMSASLQYSNYSGHAAFAIPYGIMKADKEIQDIYKKSCQSDLVQKESGLICTIFARYRASQSWFHPYSFCRFSDQSYASTGKVSR